MGFGSAQQITPLYCLQWQKKDEGILACAPTKEEAIELLEWLAQYTEMKKEKK